MKGFNKGIFVTPKDFMNRAFLGESTPDQFHDQVPEIKDELTCNEYRWADDFKTLTELEYCCSALAISRYGLFVQFWDYEVGGYGGRAELILVPWYDISKILDKDGPYADILKIYSEEYWNATIYEPEWSY